MKAIFLDIDGVLCTHSCLRARDIETEMHVFDKKCVKRLNFLIEKTGAEIVLSSTWRIAGKEIFDKHAKNQGLIKIPIDFTPELSSYKHKNGIWHMVQRGEEIQAWMDKNPVDKFVILDDSSDMAHLMSHLVHIKNGMENGLQDEHVEMALKLLED